MRTTDPSSRQSVLTARAFVRDHHALAGQLRAAGFDVRTVRGWDQLLAAPAPTPDIILVDFDAIGVSADGATVSVSGHRLVTLLARQVARLPTALIVLTELDFAEVEELAQAGVHAFVSPKQHMAVCVELVLAALKRQQARHVLGSRAKSAKSPSCQTVPVLTPAQPADHTLEHAEDSLAIAHSPAQGHAAHL